MATEEQVCKYHLSGFCKYKSTCKNLHVTDICLNKSCNSSKICLLRHPRMCKFYFNYGRCKFGSDCAYLHNHFMEDQSSDISLLQRDLVNVKNQIKKLEEMYAPSLTSWKEEYIHHLRLFQFQNNRLNFEFMNLSRTFTFYHILLMTSRAQQKF